jgi:hypothetical protein
LGSDHARSTSAAVGFGLGVLIALVTGR